jgi:tRNA1Val (adenine37-N6)-methyltransferase
MLVNSVSRKMKRWFKIEKMLLNDIVREDVKICQKQEGFKFSVDSVYLAWFVNEHTESKIIDIGSGSGVISALLAKLKGYQHITALEMQGEMYECLKCTVSESKISTQVTAIQADVREYEPENRYDAIVCNPPYRDVSSGRIPADKVKLNAKFTTTMCAEDVFCFGSKYLKTGGSIYLSYCTDRLADLFESGIKHGFEAKTIMPIYPDIDMKPKITLMRFTKGGGRELSIEKPYFIKINGQQTEQDKKIMNGEFND